MTGGEVTSFISRRERCRVLRRTAGLDKADALQALHWRDDSYVHLFNPRGRDESGCHEWVLCLIPCQWSFVLTSSSSPVEGSILLLCHCSYCIEAGVMSWAWIYVMQSNFERRAHLLSVWTSCQGPDVASDVFSLFWFQGLFRCRGCVECLEDFYGFGRSMLGFMRWQLVWGGFAIG